MGFLISGFGTEVTALKALGIALAAFLFVFWLGYRIIKAIYRAIAGRSTVEE